MWYSTEPKYRKYVQGYSLMNTATKTGIVAAKTASKWVVQKNAEATGDMIGNKIADKITSLVKTKSKEKEEERQEICIPSEKRQQIIDDMRFFWLYIIMEYQKITNLLCATPDEVPRFITKNG